MKNSVDLTENRDFRRDVFGIKKTFRQMIGDFRHSDKQSNIADKYSAEQVAEYLTDTGIIYQGNQHERSIKKLVHQFNDKIECDRCGDVIQPYENDTLCKFCRKKMWYDFVYDNIFWL